MSKALTATAGGCCPTCPAMDLSAPVLITNQSRIDHKGVTVRLQGRGPARPRTPHGAPAGPSRQA